MDSDSDSDLLLLCSLLLVFAPNSCVPVLLLLFLLMLLLFLMQLCSLAPSLARSLRVFFNWLTIILDGCIHNSLDSNQQLKHNKHTYIR